MAERRGLRHRLVSFRTLALVILGLGLVRLAIALLMPQVPSVMAPDEGTYAELAGVVGSGGDWASWNSGWGSGLYPGGRALMGPAAVLIHLGLPDLTAVRVISVLYAVGSQLLLLAIAMLARRRLAPDDPTGLPLASWPMLGIAVFVLLPSNTLWSNLGLREAACAFWILGAITCAAYLFSTRDWRWKIACGLGIAASIAMTFQSRAYLAVGLVIALASGILWFGRERPRISSALTAALIVGVMVGIPLSMRAQATTASTTSTAVQINGGQTGNLPSFVAEGARQAPSDLNLDGYIQRGSEQREASAQEADSALAIDSCAGESTQADLRTCELLRLPGAALSVLFRPIWPLDQPSAWSNLAIAASVENCLWVALIAAVAYVLITRRVLLPRVLTIALVYGGLILAGMALMEGNLGTAFRHKSNLLWVLCFVFVLAGPRRPTIVRSSATRRATEPSGNGLPSGTTR